ncbi:hypothetical protein D3C81_1935190 [compost metagenome]
MFPALSHITKKPSSLMARSSALPVETIEPPVEILCAEPATLTPMACVPAYIAENWVVIDL